MGLLGGPASIDGRAEQEAEVGVSERERKGWDVPRGRGDWKGKERRSGTELSRRAPLERPPLHLLRRSSAEEVVTHRDVTSVLVSQTLEI